MLPPAKARSTVTLPRQILMAVMIHSTIPLSHSSWPLPFKQASAKTNDGTLLGAALPTLMACEILVGVLPVFWHSFCAGKSSGQES